MRETTYRGRSVVASRAYVEQEIGRFLKFVGVDLLEEETVNISIEPDDGEYYRVVVAVPAGPLSRRERRALRRRR